eukprot:gene1412-430_t
MTKPGRVAADKTVSSVSLKAAAPWWSWATITPFVPVYSALAYVAVGEPPWALGAAASLVGESHDAADVIAAALLFAGHVILHLVCLWDPRCRAALMYRSAAAPQAATHVLIRPQPQRGIAALVPLTREPRQAVPAPFPSGGTAYHFAYQECKYTFSPATGLFSRPPGTTKLPLSMYKSMRGWSAEGAAAAAGTYGRNAFTIPLPALKELFVEHATAPFFVFQMFCVLLWCLDEYWYYSVFTGIMLCVFEAVLAKQREVNLRQLRAMEQRPYAIPALRGGRWAMVQTPDLVPWDVVLLGRTPEGCVVPADCLLLTGSCLANEAVLTGESTPLMKDSIELRLDDSPLHPRRGDKQHMVFAGTGLLTCSFTEGMPPVPCGVPSPPVQKDQAYCCGLVLRTGFDTAQGRLVRTIVHSTTRTTAANGETGLFILCLLCFAIVASPYNLWKGLQDPSRSKWKVLLSCTIIITSVVPPELPMELSLAVNHSLLNLAKLGIYCVEPFRIPFAGALSFCCFDKTGTLTDDHMNLHGIALVSPASGCTQHMPDTLHQQGKLKTQLASLAREKEAACNLPAHVPEHLKQLLVTNPGAVDQHTEYVLAACHSLALLDGRAVGDPMEQAALAWLKWSLRSPNVVGRGTRSIQILRRFPFSAQLKRMSVIVSCGGTHFALIKGAPETILPMLVSPPNNYEDVFYQLTVCGQRVLALAWRPIHFNGQNALLRMSRSDVECKMNFAGFATFECPLKADSPSTVAQLQKSSHNVAMITGDNELTACHVAKRCHMINKDPVFLRSTDNTVQWCLHDGTVVRQEELQGHSLCVNGTELQAALSRDPNWFRQYAHRVPVYARCSPEDKEVIVGALRDLGEVVLMCGDGTNDVGALKRAQLKNLSLTEEPRLLDRLRQNRQRASDGGSVEDALQQLQEDPRAGAPVVKLGEASIASPFTSRHQTIKSTADIARLGRCTLVTTLQMYKILALNCLCSAYSLSVLHADGVKFGDFQMTTASLVSASCFLFIAWSKPMDDLCPERPHTRVFSPYMMLSILGQFAVHLYCICTTVSLVGGSYTGEEEDRKVEAEFRPNLMNTVVFLLSVTQATVTFAANYQGYPFMTPLLQNRALLCAIGILSGMVFICCTEILPSFNEYIQL